MAYAHSRGILHRDLKPGNIMLGPYGETLVVDWGLAKPVGRPKEAIAHDGRRRCGPIRPARAAETRPGDTPGTPAYMSPEQAAGDLDRLGPATDVYSLGATLYCLLTGQPPFEGRGPRRGPAAGPAGRVPAAPAGQAGDRPGAGGDLPEGDGPEAGGSLCHAGALAEDLERWLADEPVAAFREGLRSRSWRGGAMSAPAVLVQPAWRPCWCSAWSASRASRR